jgi:chorismate mutase
MPVLDVALHALLPLLELKAHMGHGPAIGTGLNEIRNNILVRRQVDANGLASLTSRLSVASFVALVEALKPLPQVHADAWLARLKAFRSVRNTREADVQERADAKAAEAVRAESYVAPTPASRMPREPWQRPGGPPTFVHSLSPMAVLAARGADLATRVAASASRLGKVGKS